ncbi:MAG: SDR family NAD(P)-dependent oxidoreductase [Rhizobiaceae bacterium]|nr:SDR family NAD(P)-dependent oxidoreductase [Rhizobiaceae bacterium]
MVLKKWKTIWITGTTSGIGIELVEQLAQGSANIAISARSTEKLNVLADRHTNVFAFPLDVRDENAVAQCVADIEAAHGPIDLAILNAGVSATSSTAKPEASVFRTIIETNYLGVTNGLSALIPNMSERRSGHIAWVASLAGYNGLPGSGAYNASKAALIALAEAARPELNAKGIDLSVINPGFVRTPMTDKNRFPMPFMISPKVAAANIIRGLTKQKYEIAFPWQLALSVKFLRLLPYPLFFLAVRKMLMPRVKK